MQIHRSRPDSHFTQIPNETLRDERLSYVARGVLCELLSRPDDWDATADGIAAKAQATRARAGEGRRAMRAVFAELTAAGYLVRVRARGDGGRVITVLHLYDRARCPEATEVPPSGMPVPPADLSIAAGRTNVPVTDVPPSGTSNRTMSTNIKDGLAAGLPTGPRSKPREPERPSRAKIISDTREAISLVYGDRENVITEDEQVLDVWGYYVGINYAGIPHPVAYLAKIFRDAKEIDWLLERAVGSEEAADGLDAVGLGVFGETG